MVDRAQWMVAAVLRLHQPRHFSGDGYGWTVCAEDRQAWPCATYEAMKEAEAEHG